jgi:HPt (histidine-containing phosphotransfer) domain-containing protein
MSNKNDYIESILRFVEVCKSNIQQIEILLETENKNTLTFKRLQEEAKSLEESSLYMQAHACRLLNQQN